MDANHKNSDAVMRGQTAAEAGEPRSACPWNKANMNTIHLRRDWLRGWDSAKERERTVRA